MLRSLLLLRLEGFHRGQTEMTERFQPLPQLRKTRGKIIEIVATCNRIPLVSFVVITVCHGE